MDGETIMQCVAVTGASGFLGSHLTRRLLQRGVAVRALVRDRAKAPPDVEHAIVGDICDPAALAALMARADTAFHLASNFRTVRGSAASYWAINVEGTRLALRAARQAGVRRFVHCSTIGVHGHVRRPPADEDSPFAPDDLYQMTKVAAEEVCREEIARGGLDIVIVRPAGMYGPGDLRLLKMFQQLAHRRFPLIGSGEAHFHPVYIDDAVTGFIRAAEAPNVAGEAFIIAGAQSVPLRDLIEAAARAVGSPPPRLRLPYAPIHLAAVVCEFLCRPFGLEPPLHRRRLHFFVNNRSFRIDKARRRLAYEPEVGLDEGCLRTVAWYRSAGLLPPSPCPQ